MNRLTLTNITDAVRAMCMIIIANEVYFCELDSAAGDGDFGMSLAKGFKVIVNQWDDLPRTDIGAFLKQCGRLIVEHCGGASGPIWGAAFGSAGKRAAGKAEIDLKELGALFQSAVEGIQKVGGARLGDKTLLDALIPATESLKSSGESTISLVAAMRLAASAAAAGAERTKEMVASRGRASYVGERSLSFPDAGAIAVSILFAGIADQWEKTDGKPSQNS